MPYDLTGRDLNLISDLIEQADFPLADFLPLDQVASVFGSLYYTEASTSLDGENVVIDVQLAWEGSLEVSIPGCESFALVLASAGVGWSTVAATIVLGPDFGLRLEGVTLGLRFDEAVLKDVDSGGPAELEIAGDILFNADGVSLENPVGASLKPAYLCGTKIIVEADDVRPVFGLLAAPDFLSDQESFQGVAMELLKVSIPSELLQTDPGADLEISMENAAIGTTGFTGQVAVASADLAHAVTGKLFGFPFEFLSFALDIRENALLNASLAAELHLEVFDKPGEEKWIGIDVAFDSGGDFAASLSAVQPSGASSNPAYLVDITYTGVLRFDVSGIRLTKESDVYSLYCSGAIELLLDGAVDWPTVEFDEIGTNSNGEFLLPDGAGITFSSPMVVNWHFVRLVISKFRIGRGESSVTSLMMGLSAEVILVEGLPAGGSVEGLIVEWDPAAGGSPQVTLGGIGLEFAVSGAFRAAIEVAFSSAGGVVEFRGQGSLELYALDMGIEVGVVIGYNSVDDFRFLYLFADAKLLPSGIPIAQTGLAIFGFQGLIASNMALAIDTSLPEDERYYELFTRDPEIGITHMSKWEMKEGENALGIGIVLGTADMGFSLNVKGLLVVAFPDLTILLQCKTKFLAVKPDLTTDSEGTLDALMVYSMGQSSLSIDIVAYWGMPVLFEVTGSARAFFSFSDIHAWYLMIGQDADDKRVSAKAIGWNDNWLFNAGFWFKLDESGVVTGVLLEVGERYEAGGFWIEARGSARGEMGLFWAPPQWEGSLALEGSIGAGYKGISVGVSLRGDAEGQVFSPTKVSLEVEACFEALFWDICKSHTFSWEMEDPPSLESPVGSWTATARQWTAEVTQPGSISTGDAAELETGVATIDDSTPTIQPHSVIALEFGKSMVDTTSDFNEAVELNNDGYLTIGARSNYSARYELGSIELRRDPDGDNELVTLWGTWACETLEYNTVLRLMSSQRFGHDGSLSESFCETRELDYCDEPEDTVKCVPLAGITPGYGYLPDGSLYHWDTGRNGGVNDGGRDNEGGVVLGPGDTLTIQPPVAVDDVVVHRDPSGGAGGDDSDDAGSWLSKLCRVPMCQLLTVAMLLVLLALVLQVIGIITSSGSLWFIVTIVLVVAFLVIMWLWFCRCARDLRGSGSHVTHGSGGPGAGEPAGGTPGGGQGNDAGGENSHGGENGKPGGEAGGGENGSSTVSANSDGSVAIRPGGRIKMFCYRLGHGPSERRVGTIRGGLLTSKEEWTVPADAKILQPNETYELTVKHSPKRKAPNGSVDTPLGSNIAVTRRFRTAGPPIYNGALTNYIQSVYPSNGDRPIYTGYDFQIVFLEDYVPYLYTAVGAQLRIRLRDGQGNSLTDTNGDPLLISVDLPGAPTTQSQLQWELEYTENVENGCIEKSSLTGVTVNTAILDASSDDFSLTPNSQYIAQLVSDSDSDVPLNEWSFTTSAYKTFTDLITRDQVINVSVVATGALGATDFDSVARAVGLPTIRYVEQTTITPILDPTGAVCVAILFEAPEPMDATTRLTVKVAGVATTLISNVDQTRVLATRSDGGTWPLGVLIVDMAWKRDAGSSVPVFAVSGNTADESISLEVTA